jgi:hypothetical protein
VANGRGMAEVHFDVIAINADAMRSIAHKARGR